jgi:hypothetical protein
MPHPYVLYYVLQLLHKRTGPLSPGLGPTEVWGPLKCRVQNPYEEFFKLQISTQNVDKNSFSPFQIFSRLMTNNHTLVTGEFISMIITVLKPTSGNIFVVA